MDDQEPELVAPQLVNMSDVVAPQHTFNRIIGNQLMCSTHTTCTSITIKPTEVLEPNENGELVLVDKAP